MAEITLDLNPIVQQAMMAYVTPSHKATTYYLHHDDEAIHAIIFVPEADYPIEMDVEVVLLVRIVNHVVVIIQDTTDRPLVHKLIQKGVPRDKIVLAYAGESA